MFASLSPICLALVLLATEHVVSRSALVFLHLATTAVTLVAASFTVALIAGGGFERASTDWCILVLVVIGWHVNLQLLLVLGWLLGGVVHCSLVVGVISLIWRLFLLHVWSIRSRFHLLILSLACIVLIIVVLISVDTLVIIVIAVRIIVVVSLLADEVFTGTWDDLLPLLPNLLILDLGDISFDGWNQLIFLSAIDSQLESLLDYKIAVVVADESEKARDLADLIDKVGSCL